MSWECFRGMNWIHICMESTLNTNAYLSIVGDEVHPYMAILFPEGDSIYQQDNAPCHTARIVRKWFKQHEDDFKVLPCRIPWTLTQLRIYGTILIDMLNEWIHHQ